ncbi:hypothetical protein C8R43DRAFT_947215 [Mycena crocata]|nr:hypothetical protein C8R43DRAFT_947215 [Mycena crocata]
MFSLFAVSLALLIARPSISCPHVELQHSPRSYEEGMEIARLNNAQRDRNKYASAGKKTAITNVPVFDGHKLLPFGTVSIDGGVIVARATGAQVVDGNGGVLLSGLIEAHTHPNSVDHLEALASYGVTTTISTSCFPPPPPPPLRRLSLTHGPPGPHRRALLRDDILSIVRRFIEGGAAPPSLPILAGTDSNASPTLPYGRSLHEELQLSVEARMSTVDVLRSATVLTAQHNGMFDGGVVTPGMRADLDRQYLGDAGHPEGLDCGDGVCERHQSVK